MSAMRCGVVLLARSMSGWDACGVLRPHPADRRARRDTRRGRRTAGASSCTRTPGPRGAPRQACRAGRRTSPSTCGCRLRRRASRAGGDRSSGTGPSSFRPMSVGCCVDGHSPYGFDHVGRGAGLADGAAPPRPGRVRVGGGRRTSARRGAVDGRVAGRARGPDPPHDVAPRRARGGPGRRGGDQGVRVPRVDALPLARGRRHLPRAPGGGPAVGAAELGGVLPAGAGGLARLPGRRARRAAGRTVDGRRAGRGADEPPRLPAPEAGLRRRRRHADQAADLAGGHELRAAARRTAHLPAPRRQPAVEGHPRPRRRRSARDHGVPPDVRAGDVSTTSTTGSATA